MTLSEFTLSERGFSDLNIIKREFWFQISPTSNESWTSLSDALKDESSTALTSSDVASSFSETAFSQSTLSDLGLLVTRETWQVILSTTNTESWSNISPTGDESWSSISPSDNETWSEVIN